MPKLEKIDHCEIQILENLNLYDNSAKKTAFV